MKEQKLDWQLLLLLMSLVFLSTCTKVDRVNPFDDKTNLSPEEWAPKNLSLKIIDSTSIQITWTYDDRNIEGFKIDRKVNDLPWEVSIAVLTKNDRQFIDANIQLSSESSFTYRLYAYASKNLSEYKQISQSVLGKCIDFDGNIYETIVIGTQEWMAENLKVTHYRNGEPIPIVTDDTQWSGLKTGAYCWFNNNEAANKNIYGALYNYFTVVDSRNLCPTGWHIPSDAEWTILTTYLGGEAVAGGKMKETGTIHWSSPNTGATNESGFTALPGGIRGGGGAFDYPGGDGGFWWSSTEDGTNDAWYRYLLYDYGYVYRGRNDEGAGFSVRCVKD